MASLNESYGANSFMRFDPSGADHMRKETAGYALNADGIASASLN